MINNEVPPTYNKIKYGKVCEWCSDGKAEYFYTINRVIYPSEPEADKYSEAGGNYICKVCFLSERLNDIQKEFNGRIAELERKLERHQMREKGGH
jgi:hypothetical protein